MSTVAATSIISHWSHMFQGLQQSANDFYREVGAILGSQALKDAKVESVRFSEGGIFSAKREYLQIRRGDHVFHICAAPFGNGFFVSWWLGAVDRGFFAWLAKLPLIGRLFRIFIKPLTYYKVDTALMFQSVTHGAVLEALDKLTEGKGLRALSDVERKPAMRDLFQGIGG